MRNHCTILDLKKPIRLTYCTKKSCDCGYIHCPFCDVDHFKPSSPNRVQSHLELTHLVHAVVIKDKQIVKCFQQCKNESSKAGHYHCPYCPKAILKKTAFIRHLRGHLRNSETEEETSVQCLPDNKLPQRIILAGKEEKEVNLCKEECGDHGTSGHYHCPSCSLILSDRSQLTIHWWKCNPKPVEEPETYTHSKDIPHPKDVKELVWHASIVRSLSDIQLEKCARNDCCMGAYYHCMLCAEVLIKTKQRAKIHWRSHWNKKVVFKDYYVLPCYQRCEIEAKNILNIRCHYHCPVCGDTRRRRLAFMHHLKICMGNKHETLRYAIQWNRQLKKEDDSWMLQERETEESVSADCKDSIQRIDTTSNNDDYEEYNLDEPFVSELPPLEQRDSMRLTDDLQASMTKTHPPAVDLKKIQVFEETTAKLSHELVLAFGGETMKQLLADICDSTSLQYYTAPGISYEVLALTGQLDDICKAKSKIDKLIGDKVEKACQSENADTNHITEKSHTEETTLVAEAVNHMVNVPPNNDKDSISKSKIGLNKQSKMKKETKSLDPRKTNKSIKNKLKIKCMEISSRRYSTRGIKLDYSALAQGKEVQNDSVFLENKDSDIINDTKEDNKVTDFVTSENTNTNPENLNLNTDSCNKTERRKSNRIARKGITHLSDDLDNSDQRIMAADDYNSEEMLEVNREESLSMTQNAKVHDKDEVRKGLLMASTDHPPVQKSLPSKCNDGMSSDSAEASEENSSRLVDDVSAYIPRVIVISNKRSVKRKRSDVEDEDDDDYECEKEEESDAEGISSIYEHDNENGTSSDQNCKRKPDGNKKIIFKKGKIAKKTKFAEDDCRHCDFSGESFVDLTSHMLEKHTDVVECRCDVCHRRFDKQVHLEFHLLQKHGPLPESNFMKIPCSLCSKTFRSEHAHNLHIERKHSQNPKKKSSNHEGKSDLHVCETCGQKFRTRSHLVVHKQALHQLQKFVCEICNKSFNHIRYLQTHLKRHSGVKKFKCNVCGALFMDKKSQEVHMIYHKPPEEREYKFMCSYCGKKFLSKSQLSEHLNKHTGDKPFKCNQCQLSFAHRSTLNKHQIFVHSSERPFKCPHCHKTFKLERLLKQHIVIHTKESSFICEFCSKAFTCKHSLKQHGKKCKAGLRIPHQPTEIGIIQGESQLSVFKKKGVSLLKSPKKFTVLIDGIDISRNKDLKNDDINEGPQSETNSLPQQNNMIVVTEETVNTVYNEGQPLKVDYQIISEPVMDHASSSNIVPNESMVTMPQNQVTNQQLNNSHVTEAEVYMCSECTASFGDLASAEHHVISAHTVVDSVSYVQNNEDMVELNNITTLNV